MNSTAAPGPNLRGAVDLSALVNRPAEQSGSSTGVVFSVGDADFTRVVELSNTVPMIVEFLAPGMPPTTQQVVESYAGRLALATVDAQANPQLVQAFQVQQVPATFAVVAGRPVPLFVGTPSETELREVLEQLLQLAQQQGVTGSVDATAPDEPETEEPLPPLHQEAYDAISRGDLAAAVEAYRTAIAQDPRDQLAVAGLAQATLLQRLEGKSANAIRVAAAQHPNDLHAQFDVADLDISGGHVEDAFNRLLDIFPTMRQPDKNRTRQRLIDYFEIIGNDDPRVASARRRLTTLLY